MRGRIAKLAAEISKGAIKLGESSLINLTKWPM